MNATTLKLISNSNLAPNNNKTFSFGDLSEQLAFFTSNADYTVLADDIVFKRIKNDLIVKIPANYDDVIKYNYCMYQNVVDGKWYYAYITATEYVNPNATLLRIETDVLQTYMFDYELGESFVDREHQDRYFDNGVNTYYPYVDEHYNEVDEQLDYGRDYDITTQKLQEPYKTANPTDSGIANLGWLHIYCKEPLVDSTETSVSATNFGSSGSIQAKAIDMGVSTGLYHYITPINTASISSIYKNSDGKEYIGNLAGFINEDTRVVRIEFERYAMCEYYINPISSGIYELYPNDSDVTFKLFKFVYNTVDYGNYIIEVSNRSVNNGLTLSPITHTYNTFVYNHNNTKNVSRETKLKTYPYDFYKLYYANELTLKNEQFAGASVTVKYFKSIQADGDKVIRLTNLKNIDDKTKETMTNNQKSYDLTLLTDKWLDYQLNNKASLKSGMLVSGIATGLNVGLGLATGGIGLAVAGSSGISEGSKVANELIKRQDIKSSPDDVRQLSNNIGTMEVLDDGYIMLQHYTIKEAFKNKIYNYLYHYGYKVGDYKIPDTYTRYYFNYIKTIDTTIISDLPLFIVDKIKQLYESGLTIYHNGIVELDKENNELSLPESA